MASGSRDFARESEATLSRRKKQNAAIPSAGPPPGGLQDRLYTVQRQQQQQRHLSDAYRSTASCSCQDALASLLAQSSAAAKQQQPQTNNSCTSVNVALAALCEELLRCNTRGDAYRAMGAFGTSFQDDSTIATDECSDFSSFSSHCLSDALRSAASPAASCGGPLQPIVPASSAASTSSVPLNSNSNDLSLGVERLLWLKMLAEKDGARANKWFTGLDGQHGVDCTGADSPTASVLTTGRETETTATTNTGMEALGSSLARLCLADPSVRRHCYADPPPGFEGRCRQQQQYAVLDLHRLASSEEFD